MKTEAAEDSGSAVPVIKYFGILMVFAPICKSFPLGSRAIRFLSRMMMVSGRSSIVNSSFSFNPRNLFNQYCRRLSYNYYLVTSR